VYKVLDYNSRRRKSEISNLKTENSEFNNKINELNNHIKIMDENKINNINQDNFTNIYENEIIKINSIDDKRSFYYNI
jgi:hypothetical protein